MAGALLRQATYNRHAAKCSSGAATDQKRAGDNGNKNNQSEVSRGKQPQVDGWSFTTDVPVTKVFRGSAKASFSRSPPPLNCDAVHIGHTGTSRKLGVFASRNWPNGYKIIVEIPAMSCTYWRQRYGKRDVAEQWEKLRLSHKDDLCKRFRKLRKVPIGSNDQLTHKDHKRLETFIEEYAFRPPQSDQAHVYKLASHINHACRSCANAEHWTDSKQPHAIHVKLVRSVKRGQEIFIYYNRTGSEFPCPLCPKKTLVEQLRAFVVRIKCLYQEATVSGSRRESESTLQQKNASDTTLVSSPPRLPTIASVVNDGEPMLSHGSHVTVPPVPEP